MRSKYPVDTLSDRFGYLYRIYREVERYTVVLHHPKGDAFRIERRRWETLWGAHRWIDGNTKPFEDLPRRITSGGTTLEPDVWYTMDSLCLEFTGPQLPNRRLANPIPEFMPSDTGNVVAFHGPAQAVANAEKHLGYVFASHGFYESVLTRALNTVDDWGSSDQCRLLIEVSRMDADRETLWNDSPVL